jgi:hypothetical protein
MMFGYSSWPYSEMITESWDRLIDNCFSLYFVELLGLGLSILVFCNNHETFINS